MHCCAKGACDSAACTVRMCAMRATVHCALTMRRLRQLWHQAPCSRCNVDQINFRQTTCKFTWPKVMMACSVMCRSLLGAIHCTAAAAGLPASDPLNASTRTAVLRLRRDARVSRALRASARTRPAKVATEHACSRENAASSTREGSN